MSSALAASSSLSAYSTSHPSKRARPSSSKTSLDSSVDGDDSDDEVDPKDLSEEARAKAARKAARVCSNVPHGLGLCTDVFLRPFGIENRLNDREISGNLIWLTSNLVLLNWRRRD